MYLSLRRVRAVFRQQMQYLRRHPYSVFRIVIYPVTEILMFAIITQYLLLGSVHVAEGSFVVVGSITWILISGVQKGFALPFFDLIWEKTLPALWTSSMRLWEWLVGIALAAFTITGLTAVVIIGTTAALGVPVGRLGWSVVPTIVIGGMLGFALALVTIVCVLAWGRSATELAWGLTAMLSPLSGAYAPVSALPPALQPIARVLPTTMLFTAMRDAWNGHGIPWGAFGIAFVAALASVVVMLGVLQRSLATFRRKVKVTQFI